MSFLSKLFGGGGTGADSAPKPAAEEEYKGFTIRATPTAVGSEHQLAGVIEKQVDGSLKSHTFVRADRLGSREEAAQRALDKGKQLVDEQGEKLFR